MSNDVTWVVQLLAGAAVTILGFLLKRAIEDVGKRLAEIAADVKEIRSKVDDHATRLARLEAQYAELLRRADDTAQAVNQINLNGCARGCRWPGKET